MSVKGRVLDEHKTNLHLSMLLNIVYWQYVFCMLLQHQRPMEAVAGKAEIYLCRARSDVAGSIFLLRYCCQKARKRWKPLTEIENFSFFFNVRSASVPISVPFPANGSQNKGSQSLGSQTLVMRQVCWLNWIQFFFITI